MHTGKLPTEHIALLPRLARVCAGVALLGLGAVPSGYQQVVVPSEQAGSPEAFAPTIALEPALPRPVQGRGPDARQYDDLVRPFLVRHCLECHGIEKPKGDIRLDRLS